MTESSWGIGPEITVMAKSQLIGPEVQRFCASTKKIRGTLFVLVNAGYFLGSLQQVHVYIILDL